MSMSLDGFIEGPDRQIDWHMVDDEVHGHFNDELRRMGGFINGRRTYEKMVRAWPTADTDPASTGPMVEYAGIWKSMPKIVFSRTLQEAGWNTSIVRDVSVDEITAIKARVDGDLALCGADLAASFIRLGLIDEYRIYVHPILIGKGKPLLQAPEGRLQLELQETRTFSNRVVLLRYYRG